MEQRVLDCAKLMRFRIDPVTQCHVWYGAKVDGYGNVRVGSHSYLAHRIAYERARGPIPTGRELDHLCRNRACINPAHLEPVTHRENARRGSQAKLSVPMARELRALRQAGWSYKKLARRFGISQSLALYVVRGTNAAGAPCWNEAML